MSQLNSTQRWNQRHGLPLDAGPKEQMEYIARTAEDQETKAQALHALNLLAGHNAKILGMRSPSEADALVQQRLEALENKESEK